MLTTTRHRGASLLALSLLAMVPTSAQAKPDPYRDRDPVRQGTAPVTTSDWWFDAMKLGKAHAQTTGKGATIALMEGTLDPTVPELRGQDLVRGDACNADDVDHKVDLMPHARSYDAAHGTSMAALLIGSGKGTDNGRGIRGVAPGAKVVLYGTDYLDDVWSSCLVAFGADVVFEPVIAGDADIVNLSLTYADRNNWDGTIPKALASGKVLVAGTTTWEAQDYAPWGYPGVVNVVAVDSNAKPWVAGMPDDRVVIAAPGVEVGSGNIDEAGWRSDVWHDGTSDATAIVSGALALVKAKYPDSTGNQLIQHLIHYTGGEGYYWDKKTGFGIVSVTEMLKTSPTQWPDENPLLKSPGWAVHDYPMWSSSLIDAPKDANDKWAKAERAAAADSTPAHSDQRAEQQAKDAGGGLPTWAWIVGGAAAVVAAAAGLGALRRGKNGE